MRLRTAVSLLSVLGCVVFAGGCMASSPAESGGSGVPIAPAVAAESRAAVLATLERYMEASRAVDADRVAAFYALDGVLFEPGIEPVEGRDAIRNFIAAFPGVRVDKATATPDTIEVFGNTVLIWGRYHERLAFPGQPQSVQDGRFAMEWVRDTGGSWLVQRLFRVPLPAASP